MNEDNILGMNRDNIKLLLSQCFLSTKVSAKILFPDRFYLPFSSLHDTIFKILDDDSIQLALIIAPRGFGKTSSVNLAYPAKKILFQEKKFIVPISCTATQATMQGENLKRELLSNRLITSPFNNRENYRVGCSVGGYSNLAAGTIPIGANVYQDDDWVYVRDITGSYMSQANF